MKKIMVIALTASLCACVTPGKFYSTSTDNQCNGKGKVDLDVRYGDSKIDVTPKIDVGQGGEIIVKLKPEKGYENTKVMFDGKTANDNWLDKEMSYGDGKKQIWLCVDPNQAPGEYSYNVEVVGVGTIDPRAIVIKDNNPR
jgi:hypothetical protein